MKEIEQPTPGRGGIFLATMRHGVTKLNRDQRVGGRMDPPLLPEGVEQVEEASWNLAGTVFDVVISSPLVRAMQSAAIVTGLPIEDIVVDAEVVERFFGDMEGLSLAEIRASFPEVQYVNIGGIMYSFNPPGGESFDQLHDRARRFLHRTLRTYAGKKVLLVSHQNFLQQLHRAILGLGSLQGLRSDILHCELNTFCWSDDGSLLGHRTLQLCTSAARYPSF